MAIQPDPIIQRTRSRLRDPALKQNRATFSRLTLLVFCVLLILPAIACFKISALIGWRLVAVYIALVSGITFLIYRHDKKQAECGGWRTPEFTLHMAELLGGWAAAFLAQRVLRHKISKRRYQAVFWAIIAIHQYASFDFLNDWHFSKSAFYALHSRIEVGNASTH